MTSFLKDVLPWITPPVIGAVIGYVTNDIAIRMLFRPLRPMRVFGLRLPFTPGIFPKERYNLSRSIGRMVSRELITVEAVRGQLHAPRTVAQLSAGLSSITQGILETPLSRLTGGLESLLSRSLTEIIGKALRRFLASPSAAGVIRGLIDGGAAAVSSLKLGELLDRLGFRSLLSDAVLPILAGEGARDSISGFLGREAAGNAGTFLTDDVIEGVAGVLDSFADPAADRLVEWLGTPEMREELSIHGRRFISGALEKLNVFQRFILSAGQFERRLDEKMPEIVEDVLRALESAARDPANRRRLMEAVRGALRDRRSGKKTRGMDGIAGHAARILSGILARLGDPGERARIAAALEKAVTGSGDLTVGQRLREIPGFDSVKAMEKLSAAVIGYATDGSAADALSDRLAGYAAGFLADNAETPLGALLGVDAGRKAELDAFLFNRLLELVDARLPEIIAGIDVQELVVKKIDALEVQEVEKLLRDVIWSHLRWINIFGAILGFIIGAVQTALRAVGLY